MKNLEPRYRELCTRCRQPGFSCYCAHVQSFDPFIRFVILIHPIEVKRRIATGRMSHLVLQNSELIKGYHFAQNEKVNEILREPGAQNLILYPGRASANLSAMTEEQKNEKFSRAGKLNIFVIDGTWATAGKMIRQSPNLMELERICFVPEKLSQFRVRKQPKPECLSTIEAIHQTVELLGAQRGFDLGSGRHEVLLNVFNHMVETQLSSMREAYEKPRERAYRRPKFRVA